MDRHSALQATMKRFFIALFLSIATFRAQAVTLAALNPGMELTTQFVNNSGYPDNQVYVLVLARNAGGVQCYVDAAGNMIPIPGGQNTSMYSMTLSSFTALQFPPTMTAGRLWISYGSPLNMATFAGGGIAQPNLGNPGDPNINIKFDWMEFTVGGGQFFGNTTQVDMFGIPYTMSLYDDGGGLNSTRGIPLCYDDVASQYQAFMNSIAGANVFNSLVGPIRIVAPGHGSFAAGQPNGNYFDAYISANWGPYAGLGPQPSTQDVFGASGVLATQAVIDASFNRHVINTGNVNNPAAYYQAGPANYYAAFWHQINLAGMAYGFPYDDSNNQSSLQVSAHPRALVITLSGCVPTPTATPTFSSTRSSTPTATKTATPSRTTTMTSSPTLTRSPTSSLTATTTLTRTPTPSVTVTSTFSMTPTRSMTSTLTASPSPSKTGTLTASQTTSSTLTRSETPSVTLTFSVTSTLSFTLSRSPTLTQSPTPTQTKTITPGSTPTSTTTPSQTSTFTATLTQSPSRTATLTPTSSMTSSSTLSPTSTYAQSRTSTPNSSPTLSPTPSSSSTLSPTRSSTPSATATLSRSPTSSQTPSFTPPVSSTFNPSASSTPTSTVVIPLNFSFDLEIFNSAGERVRVLLQGGRFASYPTDWKISDAQALPDEGKPALIVASGTTFPFDGRNDQGQALAGGIYYARLQIKDSFGKTSSYSGAVSVMRDPSDARLCVSNSAGEFVRCLNIAYASGIVPQGEGRLNSGSLVAGKNTDLNWDNAVSTWDGTDSQGNPVKGGIYTLTLRVQDAGGAKVKTWQVQVLEAPEAPLSVKLSSNPWRSGALKVEWAGGLAEAEIFSLAGERVATSSNGLFSERGYASGIYVVLVQKGRQRASFKLAIIR